MARVCKKLIQAGYAISIESGAGDPAVSRPLIANRLTVESDGAGGAARADLVLKVNAPEAELARQRDRWMREGAIYIGFLMPLLNPRRGTGACRRRITSFSTDANADESGRPWKPSPRWPTSRATRARCLPLRS